MYILTEDDYILWEESPYWAYSLWKRCDVLNSWFPKPSYGNIRNIAYNMRNAMRDLTKNLKGEKISLRLVGYYKPFLDKRKVRNMLVYEQSLNRFYILPVVVLHFIEASGSVAQACVELLRYEDRFFAIHFKSEPVFFSWLLPLESTRSTYATLLPEEFLK